jgi:hypothetical protein
MLSLDLCLDKHPRQVGGQVTVPTLDPTAPGFILCSQGTIMQPLPLFLFSFSFCVVCAARA